MAFDCNELQEFSAMRRHENQRENDVPQPPPLEREAKIEGNRGWLSVYNLYL